MKNKIIINLILICICVSSFSSCSPSDEEIKRDICELAETTELGTIEATVRKIVKVSDKDWYKVGDRSLLFRCTAYMKSGLDLSRMTPDDIVIDRKMKSITLTLPAPELLSLDVPAEKTDLVYSHISLLRSDFSVQERNEILRQGEEDIRSDYPEMGIVEETKESARNMFTVILSRFGFKSVIVKYKENE